MQTKSANGVWRDALRSHLWDRTRGMNETRFEELFTRISSEIVQTRNSNLSRSGRPTDEQEMIARAIVFFRQHPQYGIS